MKFGYSKAKPHIKIQKGQNAFLVKYNERENSHRSEIDSPATHWILCPFVIKPFSLAPEGT